ncbi:MAG: DUF2723 domain-containing protein [Flavobacteriaceae bacterium]|nr:DUF2723 domain-containing protein [Flavobacteriaceae bacterium]
MLSFNYNKYNNIFGWFVFAVALITYTLTLEPTVSYWDCGEYISTSVKLAVGHPPGAPLFQMLGAFFAMFATDVTQIAKMVNFMSALSSAFTILFLFWSITYLSKKLILKKDVELIKSQAYAVLGSGVVGALAYTFSDSFWFSAVEAEVYAMSSFLMALLLWLGLRWEAEIDKPRGHKWLLLISFVVGLSFGVHILSLLVIPSVVFIYYFKTYKEITIKGFLIANIVSILVLAFVFKFLFPFTLKYFSFMELTFVNTFGLPFNSGSIFAALLLIVGFYYGLKYTRDKNLKTANLLVLCILFIMIGFSSWLMLPIRANANTTINENNPSSARELLAYYNREQYGDANVFYDDFYTTLYDRSLDEDEPFIDGTPKYEKDEKLGEYVIVNKNEYKKSIPNYGSEHKGFIPRMVDPTVSTINEYIHITGKLPKFKLKPKKDINEFYHKHYDKIKGNYEGFMDSYLSGQQDRKAYMKYLDENQEFLNVKKPNFIDNIRFMIDYQFGTMYGRYFMWNFVGKQDDIQHQLNNHGNWLSGIDFVDSQRLGSQRELPKEVLENKGRNTYYFLPFILGLIGLMFQLQRDKRNFYMLFLFFIFTGLAVLFYTNPKPFEPRERDYAVVGSFYIFAIWIGFGVLALFESVKKFINPKTASIAISVLCLLAVPLLMASENWDDHDRSNRFSAHLNAKAYIDSLGKNAILFTIGDNDTFPLWYMQEVENYRTDVKLINTSLFATDWYIDQQKRATYDAAPIPSQLTHKDYRTGALDIAYHKPKDVGQFAVKDLSHSVDTVKLDVKKDQRIDIKFFMSWLASKDKKTTDDIRDNNHFEKTYPTNKLRLYIDKEAVLKNGIVQPEEADLIVPYIDFDIDENGLTKNRILMLDILANNNWERPIYFTGGSFADEEYLWLKDYLQLDGLAYKLVPIKSTSKEGSPMDLGRINTTLLYAYFKKLDFKNSNDTSVYVDSESRRNSISYRNNLNRLAEALIKKGELAKAEEMLDLSVEKLPIKMYKHYSLSLGLIENYYVIDKKEKARDIAKILISVFQDNLRYYATLNKSEIDFNFDEIGTDLLMYGNIIETASKHDKVFAAEQLDTALEKIPFKMYRTEGFGLTAIESYHKIGKTKKAQKLSKKLIDSYTEELTAFAN